MTEGFFDSQIVIKCINEIAVLQEEVMVFAQFADFATIEHQRQNIENLRNLMDKQRNMFFRCTLSDDPEAKEMATEIIEHFQEHGHIIDPTNPIKVFDEIAVQIQEMEDDLDYAEEHGYFPGEEPGGETPPYTL